MILFWVARAPIDRQTRDLTVFYSEKVGDFIDPFGMVSLDLDSDPIADDQELIEMRIGTAAILE